MTKVRFAYCKEADGDLTIDQARTYYFSLPENTRKRLTFLCSDPVCRMPITGVNYDKLPAEIARRAGYSENRIHKYKEACEWKKLEVSTTTEQWPGEDNEEYHSRLVDQKLGCLINAFNPAKVKQDSPTPLTIRRTITKTVLSKIRARVREKTRPRQKGNAERSRRHPASIK
jgi:hypothetical protein